MKQLDGFTDGLVNLIVQEYVTVVTKSVDDEPNEVWYLIEQHFGVDTRS